MTEDMTEEPKLLGETVTVCPHCKLDLNHRITLMAGDRPKRVLCLTCQFEHAYRAGGGGGDRQTPASRTLSGREMAEVRRSGEENAWRAKLSDPAKTPIPYGVAAEFRLDDHVEHVSFGRGLVIGFSEPDKVQIYFGGEIKLMKGRRVADTPPPKPALGKFLFT